VKQEYILTADRGAIWGGGRQVWTECTTPNLSTSNKRHGISCVVLCRHWKHTPAQGNV